MKLIDSDKILEALGAFSDETHGDPHFRAAIASAREIIEGMPEAVVRCRDCKWWMAHPKWQTESGYCKYILVLFYVAKKADDYCSCGERRSDEID